MAIIREEIIGNQRLILGDCIKVMPLLGKVDAVVTDPPYGIGESQKKNLSRHKLSECTVYAGGDFDHQPASGEQIAAMRDLSANQIIWGGNYFDLPPSKCWLVWDKQNGASDFADCELAWTNMNRAVRRIYWQWSGMIRKGEARGVKRVHLTQKPLEVMEWCLGFLPDAKTILDPFAGSGTVAVACQRMGRFSTSIEIDPDYFEIMCKRVDEAARQPDLLIPETQPKPIQEQLL